MDKDYNDHVRKLRLPKEREESRQPYNFIVRYNKVYPLDDVDGGPNKKGLDWVRQPDGESNEVRPIEGAGLDVQTDRAAIMEMLRKIPRDEFYAAAYVYGDSFSCFSSLKELRSSRPAWNTDGSLRPRFKNSSSPKKERHPHRCRSAGN